MYYLFAETSDQWKVYWNDVRKFGSDSSDNRISLEIAIPIGRSNNLTRSNLERALRLSEIDWLYYRSGRWHIDAIKFKSNFSLVEKEKWLNGTMFLDLEIKERRSLFKYLIGRQAICHFALTPDMAENQMSKKIFLSHKGINKPFVKRFELSLNAIGLQPWLDETAMAAGTELERGILRGFEESCAAVFFVTPDFKDENFIASEIDYAIDQKRVKGDKFSIITLVFSDSLGNRGNVPPLLKRYVWKTPENELTALTEIIRALPISIGESGWRS